MLKAWSLPPTGNPPPLPGSHYDGRASITAASCRQHFAAASNRQSPWWKKADLGCFRQMEIFDQEFTAKAPPLT
jgi:hypothetical protein